MSDPSLLPIAVFAVVATFSRLLTSSFYNLTSNGTVYQQVIGEKHHNLCGCSTHWQHRGTIWEGLGTLGAVHEVAIVVFWSLAVAMVRGVEFLRRGV